MRVRLKGHKNHYKYTLAHYEYALAHYKYTLGGSDVYSTSTNAYSLPLLHIRNGFFMTLSLTLNTELSPWELRLRRIVLSIWVDTLQINS